MCRRWVTSLKKALEKAAPPTPRVYPAVCSSYPDVKQSRKAGLFQDVHPLGWKQWKKTCIGSFLWHRTKGVQLQAQWQAKGLC